MRHSTTHHHSADQDHHRTRGGRFFESGDLRSILLSLIAETPRHGYEIIKILESRLGHAPSPGIVYPTLTLLEEMGLASVTAEGSRKRFTISPAGRAELEASQPQVNAILERMQAAGERHARGRSGPFLRTMENLKLVLRMRAGDWNVEQIGSAIDILDDAARRLERL